MSAQSSDVHGPVVHRCKSIKSVNFSDLWRTELNHNAVHQHRKCNSRSLLNLNYYVPALLLSRQTCRVAHNQNNGIPSQEHLANVSVLVHRRATLATLATLGGLRPHLLDVLEEQIEMPVVSDVDVNGKIGGDERRIRMAINK